MNYEASAEQAIPPALAALPQMLKDGNLPLIQQALDSGELAMLPQYLTGEQMREFEFSARAGDIAAVRSTVAGVEVPGVGVLWPKKRNPWPIIAIVVVVLALLGIGAWLLFGGDDTQNIPDTLAGDSNYTTFADLIEKAGLTDLLSQTGPYTVFAPDNAAFEALPPKELQVLESDDAKLREVVQYQITTGELSSDDLPVKIPTQEGSDLTVTGSGSGSSATINGSAKIIAADIEASNGLIQGIDEVLIPPGVDLNAPSENVVELLSNNPDYSTLANLMNTAGLSNTLSGAGPFTVFAPDNAAFDALPQEQLDALAANPNLLRQVLNYHVTAGELTTAELTTTQVNSLEGSTLDIVVSGDTVTVNGAKVVDPNLLASNGVVQGINAVLIPPGLELTTTTTSTTSTSSPTTTPTTESTTSTTTTTTTSTTSSTTTTTAVP